MQQRIVLVGGHGLTETFDPHVCPDHSGYVVSNANRRALIKGTMNWKPQDWIEHASFGIGRVNENRGDRLDIDFINSGSKTILRTTELKPAISPADFKSPKVKRKSPSPRIKIGV